MDGWRECRLGVFARGGKGRGMIPVLEYRYCSGFTDPRSECFFLFFFAREFLGRGWLLDF